MVAQLPRLHHVVFCVRSDNQDRAAGFWRDLGIVFNEIDLPDLGLRVLLAWEAGIEIISPTSEAGPEAANFTQFLDQSGEGVYSVVVRTAEVGEPVAVAERYGMPVLYRQHRNGDGFELDEVMLAPLHGMPVTFLSTDRPD